MSRSPGSQGRRPTPWPSSFSSRAKTQIPNAQGLSSPSPSPHALTGYTNEPLSCRSTGEFFETKPIIIEATGLHKPCSPSWPLLLDPSESRSNRPQAGPGPPCSPPEGAPSSFRTPGPLQLPSSSPGASLQPPPPLPAPTVRASAKRPT